MQTLKTLLLLTAMSFVVASCGGKKTGDAGSSAPADSNEAKAAAQLCECFSGKTELIEKITAAANPTDLQSVVMESMAEFNDMQQCMSKVDEIEAGETPAERLAFGKKVQGELGSRCPKVAAFMKKMEDMMKPG